MHCSVDIILVHRISSQDSLFHCDFRNETNSPCFKLVQGKQITRTIKSDAGGAQLLVKGDPASSENNPCHQKVRSEHTED
ncbi:unnamed protein product [Fusarium graminearum]|uniref:Chromosome 3, complete genome n=1 Tax=Gibberella zeae (strain ATCC MYA-4620 / CBS 123657 / FGSC 9075 / NRRL 31084 / PH-1) TaxID=229533 RepID=A0A0E0SJI0_GIBZE|nr:hypothetical protein FG05_30627 [Fusarium graminearum]CEF86593.1 unnamed protein product [Fusarium graminearum]CZS83736.1 unnamed protein product [Fusarium graminearum]